MLDYEKKPIWVDSVKNGKFICTVCGYKTDKKAHLKKHTDHYHKPYSFILYFHCESSDSRDIILENIPYQYIDSTGGESAFDDGNIDDFGDSIVKVAKKYKIKLYRICRMFDPGLGLIAPDWWIDGGIKAKMFYDYEIPKNLLAKD